MNIDHTEEPNSLPWKYVEETAISAIRDSIRAEIAGAMVIQILSDHSFEVSGPNNEKCFRKDCGDLSNLGPEGLPLVIHGWLDQRFGSTWSDTFYASWLNRWHWQELFTESRIGEFDGFFVVITINLGILFLVAEVKHHGRPVSRLMLESFSHRLRV